jgi:hypothetical protein
MWSFEKAPIYNSAPGYQAAARYRPRPRPHHLLKRTTNSVKKAALTRGCIHQPLPLIAVNLDSPTQENARLFFALAADGDDPATLASLRN